MTYVIDKMLPDDWERVREIYEEGIATGNATFETSAPAWEKWDSAHLNGARLVARSAGEVLGWAALSRVSERCVYAGVAEVSVYVASASQGSGIGGALLEALILESERSGIWTLQAGIFPENRSSISIHKKYGFREIGVRMRLGKLNGIWRDVMLLERRSDKTGID